MKEIIATFSIVTPMFIGGADQNPDGIRPPSVKGALRFWWRALNWSKFSSESYDDEAKALQNLHKEECRIFGSSMRDNKGGQGCFLLSIQTEKLDISEAGTVHNLFKENDASRYLGYGLMEAFASRNKGVEAGELVRGCINAEQSFEVKLIFKKDIDPSVKESLIAWGLLGGLGSRNRHGLGSISLENLVENGVNIWKKAESKETYSQQLKELLDNKFGARNPSPFSCFDEKSRVEMLLSTNTPFKALNNIGEAMLMYRSAGRAGRVLGKNSEKNFANDHDWKYRSRNQDKRWNSKDLPSNFHPQRAVFGLPHNYDKRDYQSVTPEINERRSSPLFIHVHRLHDKSFVVLSIFLPCLFLPKGEKINAGGIKVANKIDYGVITRFLEGTDTNNLDRFPKREFICKGESV